MISGELAWLAASITERIGSYFQNQPCIVTPPPRLSDSCYKTFIDTHDLGTDERKIVALALAAQIAPQMLDIFMTANELYNKPYSEFGGLSGNTHHGFLPTVQTALFLLCGDDRERYIEALRLFEPSGKLYKKDILDTQDNSPTPIHNRLLLSRSAMKSILYGEELDHEYNPSFPASLLETNYEWESLVLPPYTMEHLRELDMWLRHSDTLLGEWEMERFIKHGYKALFYGSSGTGKTLTASLLGKRFGRKVYRVDLSQVVSKYIGETEKNLENIFRTAERRDWILFFDEADSLFGKRTSVSSSNDKYANQETAYLLQRVEEYEGLVILATNLKDNFDEAFLRRFQSIIYFPLPDESERLRLWRQGFSPRADISGLDLPELAKEYELTGANIINIIRTASLMAIDRGGNRILPDDILTCIRREKYKEGKII